MLGDVLILVLLLITFLLSCLLAFWRLLQRRRLTILDVIKVLRPVDARRVDQLLDCRVDGGLRAVFSRRQFAEEQLSALYEIREHLLRMSHNAFVLIVWANTELWREVKERPGMENSEEYIYLGNRLYGAAVEFRAFVFLTLIRVNIWIIVRARAWSPFRIPNLVELQQLGDLRFHASYMRLREAVGALCLVYGEEFYDEILSMM